MKKILLIISILVLLVSCNPDEGVSAVEGSLRIITIDNCQYIEYRYGFEGWNGYAYSITHKGNCTNPQHIK